METITKKDLDQYQRVILEAVDAGFGKAAEERSRIIDLMEEKFSKVDIRMDRLEDAIRDLAGTVDKFIQRLVYMEDELAVINAKLEKVTSFLKEKFGVEISAQ